MGTGGGMHSVLNLLNFVHKRDICVKINIHSACEKHRSAIVILGI